MKISLKKSFAIFSSLILLSFTACAKPKNTNTNNTGNTVKSEKGKLKVAYDYLYIGDYAYSFCVTDIYGDDYITDPAEFNIDSDGEISFYEE